MGKARRVGGTGWAGVSGSFVGLSKGKSSGNGNIRIRQPKKKKPLPPAKIDLATLPDNLEVQRAAKRVQAVQLDIDAAQKRLHLLQSQLSTLMGELKVAVQIARPMKPRCVATKPKAKAGPNAKRPKQSAADRLAENKARANFRNAPKEVEVEHRVDGVVVGKRIVTRS